MSKAKSVETKAPPEPEEIPVGQKYFDNMFLLLALSVIITAVVYNIWGLIETLGVPPAP